MDLPRFAQLDVTLYPKSERYLSQPVKHATPPTRPHLRLGVALSCPHSTPHLLEDSRKATYTMERPHGMHRFKLSDCDKQNPGTSLEPGSLFFKGIYIFTRLFRKRSCVRKKVGEPSPRGTSMRCQPRPGLEQSILLVRAARYLASRRLMRSYSGANKVKGREDDQSRAWRPRRSCHPAQFELKWLWRLLHTVDGCLSSACMYQWAALPVRGRKWSSTRYCRSVTTGRYTVVLLGRLSNQSPETGHFKTPPTY